MRLFALSILFLATSAHAAETATTDGPGFVMIGGEQPPAPVVAPTATNPPAVAVNVTPPPATDLYRANGIVRRNQWTNTPAQPLRDDRCYNYFSLLGQSPVSPSDSTAYVRALQSVYQGGRIVLHHTAADRQTAEEVLGDHQANGWGDMGYHFYIKKDCTILEGRPLHMMGTHAGHMPLRVGQCLRNGQSRYDLSNDFDFKSIGIVMEGNANRNDLTANCGAKLNQLIQSLHTTFGISKIGGHGHYKADGQGTDCPGDHMEAWMRRNLGANSGMKLEGTGDEDQNALVNLILNANGQVSTSTMQRNFENGVGYTKAQEAGRIPAGTVPINDSNGGKAAWCTECGN